MVISKKNYNQEYYKKHRNKWKGYKKRQLSKKYYSKYVKKYMKKYVKKYYRKNRKKILEYQKEYGQNNKENINVRKREDYHTKEIVRKKELARGKSQKIKIPKNQICGICKKRLAKEKHHGNYNNPYDIIFLCKKCHINTQKK